MEVSLTDYDIKKLIPEANIVPYNKIHKMSIEEILGQHGCAVILYLLKPSYGHWVCLFKRDGKLSYFNSYGEEPDNDFKYIKSDIRKQMNEIEPYLFEKMAHSGYECEYNDFDFQKRVKGINTCGRHVCVRLWNRHLSPEEYEKRMKFVSKANKKSYDEIVVNMVYPYLKK
jgi:hypothetical protein